MRGSRNLYPLLGQGTRVAVGQVRSIERALSLGLDLPDEVGLVLPLGFDIIRGRGAVPALMRDLAIVSETGAALEMPFVVAQALGRGAPLPLGLNIVTGAGVALPVRTEILIDRTSGTNIGDMTVLGGLSAAFDGLKNVANSSCAASSGVSGYVGKTYGAGKVFSKAVVYGSNDHGFIFTVNPSVTLKIYGKNGTPANKTDGTVIGSLTFTDTTNESAGRTVTSTDLVNKWTSIWCYVNDGAADSHLVGELELYEWL